MATDYQERTRSLCDLPWSGRHGCYVVFHVKITVVPCASTLLKKLDAV